MINHRLLKQGKDYLFMFNPIPAVNGGELMYISPTKATVLEIENVELKVKTADGEIVYIPVQYIHDVEAVKGGGRRRKQTRKGRKGTRKGVRKVHRKSRRSTCK